MFAKFVLSGKTPTCWDAIAWPSDYIAFFFRSISSISESFMSVPAAIIVGSILCQKRLIINVLFTLCFRNNYAYQDFVSQIWVNRSSYKCLASSSIYTLTFFNLIMRFLFSCRVQCWNCWTLAWLFGCRRSEQGMSCCNVALLDYKLISR